MSPITLYKAGLDGRWHHPTLPDVIPDDDDPGGGGGGGELWYGVPIFGQSYARYKQQVIGSAAGRYRQVEYDTAYGGNRGGGVLRVYQNPGDPFSWDNACPSYVRAGHPICYSFLDYGSGETNFKNSVKAWLDDKDANDPTRRVWLTFKHEWDNDGGNHVGGANVNNWLDRHIWVREVLEEGAYEHHAAVNGGAIKFGPISTGVCFAKGTRGSKNAETAAKDYQKYNDAMEARSGRDIQEIWDYWGCDRYNPGWDGASLYMPWSNWAVRMIECNQRTGLPFVIGEGGSARDTRSLSVTARDTDRAAWFKTQCDNIIAAGFFDAFMWWRVPATSNQFNAFSTVMITPSGFNDAMLPDVMQNGGPDAPLVCAVHNEYCVKSIAAANANGLGPTIPYHTAGPA